jgi:uncharacterized protein (DUF362 family)
MAVRIGRREFLKDGAALGVTAVLGKGNLNELAREKSVVAVGVGGDPGKATLGAVKLLGGIANFVPKRSKVAVLVNVQSRHPGTFTRPEILRETLRLCRGAGAAGVDCLSLQPMKQWQDTGLAKVVEEEGARLKLFDPKDESLFRAVQVVDGRSLQEAKVLNEFFGHDVFINMPITKDHAGNKYTGVMKNLMGLNFSATNRSFHKPNWKTDLNDIAHLEQCIVDLNKTIRPTLNIVDATEFISTNGPFGPGELLKPGKVVAGTDRVAVDAYCASLLGLKAGDIIQIVRASEQGLGEMDLLKVRIREIKV